MCSIFRPVPVEDPVAEVEDEEVRADPYEPM